MATGFMIQMTGLSRSVTVIRSGLLALAILALASCSEVVTADSNAASDSLNANASTGVTSLTSLYAGAQFSSGPPTVGAMAPADGSSGVSILSPIVVIFSESVDPGSVNTETFKVVDLSGSSGFFGGGPSLDGVVSVDPETGNRAAVFLPLSPLPPGSDIEVRLTPGIQDLVGESLELPASSDESDGSDETGLGGFLDPTPGEPPPETDPPLFQFTTMGPGASPFPFDVISMYPPPGGKNVSRETAITLYFSAPVKKNSVTASDAIRVLRASNSEPIKGTVKVLGDPRVVRFTPKSPFKMGDRIKVKASTSIQRQDIPTVGGAKNLQHTFSATFEITDIPTPSLITLPGNAPLTMGPLSFSGTLKQENFKRFKADVKISKGARKVDGVTLVFFQEKGVGTGLTAARAFSEKGGSATTSFKLDLSKGDESAAFEDSNKTAPPSPMLLGAFASTGDLNSPVGPLELPSVFVEVTKPNVVFGPPSVEGERYTFRTELAEPVVYGTATEPVADLEIVIDGTTMPSVMDAARLSGFTAVTDENDFFMTHLPVPVLPGTPPQPSPRFVPLEISDLFIRDKVGNERNKMAPDAGTIHFEGSVGGALNEGSSVGTIQVRVVDAESLLPLKNVKVQVQAFPYDPLANPAQVIITRKTNKKGRANFSSADLHQLDTPLIIGPELMVTAYRSNRDVFTIAGLENPVVGVASFGISIPLLKSNSEKVVVQVKTEEDITEMDPGHAFIASGANTGIPFAGLATLFEDSRFFVKGYPPPSATNFLLVQKARPHVVNNFEHDGGGTYVHQSSPIQAVEETTTLTFNYFEKGVAMEFSDTFANTTIQQADVTAAGITENPFGITRARLTGRIPGLPGVLPVSYSPEPLGPDNGVSQVLFAPIPPSLWINEVDPKIDPAYQILFQPEAGTGSADPSEALLEEHFFFEVEAAESGTQRLSRHRAALDFVTGSGAVTTAADPVRFPIVPVVQQSGMLHPATVLVDVSGGGVPTIVPADSLFRFTMQPAESSRKWTVLLSPAVTPITPLEFSFPEIPSNDFSQPGSFSLTAECIEFEPGTFDFDAFMFSDIERDHRKLARSKEEQLTTTP